MYCTLQFTTLSHPVRSMYKSYKLLAFKTLKQLLITSRSYTKVIPKMEEILLSEAKTIVPLMLSGNHKGAAGRIGVIGGSLEYTGAPYFAAIAAMKVGCDLAHVFCQKSAASVIKSYSPELIVHPLLDDDKAVELITPWFERLHALIIGPGLGRDENILNTVSLLIQYCRNRSQNLPLVIDADGLFLVTKHPELVCNYPGGIILTPNAMEFSRLAKSVLNETWVPTPNPPPANVCKLAAALGSNIVIVHKGVADVIATNEEHFECTAQGSGRRCGGQGDLLCGSLGTFFAWASSNGRSSERSAGVIASYAACRLIRDCNMRAFKKTGRSTLASDMIQEIHPAFQELFEP